MQRAKSICRKTNCGALIDTPGFCVDHPPKKFEGLARAPGSRAFYGGSRWTKTSRAYRRANPLCAGHGRLGRVLKGDMVHHTIERPELVAKGLDPYDWEYLETLCNACHNRELRTRRGDVRAKDGCSASIAAYYTSEMRRMYK